MRGECPGGCVGRDGADVYVTAKPAGREVTRVTKFAPTTLRMDCRPRRISASERRYIDYDDVDAPSSTPPPPANQEYHIATRAASARAAPLPAGDARAVGVAAKRPAGDVDAGAASKPAGKAAAAPRPRRVRRSPGEMPPEFIPPAVVHVSPEARLERTGAQLRSLAMVEQDAAVREDLLAEARRYDDAHASEPAPQEPLHNQLQVVQHLGTGVYGTVWSATCMQYGESKRLAAIKSIGMAKENPRWREVEVETRVLAIARARCDNCVNLLALPEQREQVNDHGRLETFQPLVLEFVPYTLTAWLEMARRVEADGYVVGGARRMHPDTEHIRCLCRQLAEAVAFLHRCGVVHRDLKAENILVTAQGLLKLNDFGMAAFVGDQPTGKDKCTLWERPPEALIGHGMTFADVPEDRRQSYQLALHVAEVKFDIWSTACLFFRIMSGGEIWLLHTNKYEPKEVDFKRVNAAQLELLARMRQLLGAPTDSERSYLASLPMWRRCEAYVLDTRSAMSDCIEYRVHSFKHYNVCSHDHCLCRLLKQMLRWNPSDRISAVQVLRHPFFYEPVPACVHKRYDPAHMQLPPPLPPPPTPTQPPAGNAAAPVPVVSVQHRA